MCFNAAASVAPRTQGGAAGSSGGLGWVLTTFLFSTPCMSLYCTCIAPPASQSSGTRTRHRSRAWSYREGRVSGQRMRETSVSSQYAHRCVTESRQSRVAVRVCIAVGFAAAFRRDRD
eukprot:551193-Rhodomonas_salina.1